MSKIVVLLVEDQSLLRMEMVEVLEEAGFAVAEGSDAASGMALFDARSAEISALVTDIHLGDGPRGWEVARHCRQVAPALPVVYVSGDSAGEWSAEGVPDSIMITKPFVMVQLITALSTLLNSATVVQHLANPTDGQDP